MSIAYSDVLPKIRRSLEYLDDGYHGLIIALKGRLDCYRLPLSFHLGIVYKSFRDGGLPLKGLEV